MRGVYLLATVSLSILLAACTVIEGAGEVDQGRQAMLEGHYTRALGLFEEAEKTDPGYVYGTELMAGVDSYLGRTQYLTGNYAQARATLMKAVAKHKSDNVARLYLGLTQYRLGDQKAALTNIQRGMQGIYNWLEYLNTNFAQDFGRDWDISGTIRGRIKKDFAIISSDNIDWPQLVADGEHLGMRIEDEEDYFRTQDLRS
jgi:tetratricopeptide (TPR) repeat protein